jgi:hypothetical protein
VLLKLVLALARALLLPAVHELLLLLLCCCSAAAHLSSFGPQSPWALDEQPRQ